MAEHKMGQTTRWILTSTLDLNTEQLEANLEAEWQCHYTINGNKEEHDNLVCKWTLHILWWGTCYQQSAIIHLNPYPNTILWLAKPAWLACAIE